MPRYYKPKVNKFVTLTASIPVALGAGLAYSFSIWSPALQHAYNLDQKSLEIIGSACNVGGYLSIISGLIYDNLEHRHHVGPRLTLLIGGLVNFTGFGLLWAAVTHRIQASVYQLALFAAIAGLGGTFLDTSAVSTNLRNFPGHRGTVLGVIKSGVGLSASLYTSVYSGFLQPRADRFLLVLAVVPTTVCFMSLLFINFVPFVQRSEIDSEQALFTTKGRFLFLLQSIAALALYLMASALITGLGAVSGDTRAVLAAGTLAVLLPLFFTPAGSGGLFAQRASAELQRAASVLEPGLENDESSSSDGDNDTNDAMTESLLLPPPPPVATEEATEHNTEQLESQQSVLPPLLPPSQQPIVQPIGPLTALRRLNFWLLATICGIGIGCGLAFLNNLAQLVQSLEGPNEARGVLVSLFGVANCAGRLLFGVLPERFLHSHAIPRPMFLVLAGLMTCSTFAALAFAAVPVLYGLALSAGIAFGAHWTLMPSLASELFGLDSFASIYTMLQLAPAVSGYALGAGLIWAVYKEALKKHGLPESGVCIGRDCFRGSFLTMAGLAAVASCLSVWLTMRTRMMYKEEAAALRRLERDLSNKRREGGR